MAIHTRWQLHRLFSSDGWEQTDFTLDTLPWDLAFLDFNRALSVCEFPDFPFSSSNTTSWILCNSLFYFVLLFYLKAYYLTGLWELCDNWVLLLSLWDRKLIIPIFFNAFSKGKLPLSFSLLKIKVWLIHTHKKYTLNF